MSISIDAKSCIIDGRRSLLLSGAIHYPRSTPAMWPGLMQEARAGGLNCVETYVFWNQHERERGKYDFSGRLDLRHFCECAASEGLKVFLRPGPYICAEQDYGGFPAWLRDAPGVRLRTKNEAYYDEVRKWFDILFAYLLPLFDRAGGPIIAVQVENEYANIGPAYGGEGGAYMTWLRDLIAGYETGAPLTACNPVGSAEMMLAAPKLERAVPTLNAGFAHPFVRTFKRWASGHPCLWTEAWMAWYQVWGLPRPFRPAANMAWCAARFFAEGGKGINYFPWHGGTNFGRTGMYLQAANYDFDAALDEFGCRTRKFELLSSLNHALRAHEDTLVECDLPEARRAGDGLEARVFSHGGKSVVFLCNDNPPPDGARAMEWGGRNYSLPAQSVLMLADGREIWRGADSDAPDPVARVFVPASSFGKSDWLVADEPPPDVTGDWLAIGQPSEQLAFTKNKSDYAWYKCELSVNSVATQKGTLVFEGINDFFQVFVDGARAAVSRTHLPEDRGAWDSADYRQSFEMELAPGHHELTLLVCSLGLIKGDWQAGRSNMAEERKGFWGRVVWLPVATASSGAVVRFGEWSIHAGLAGERAAGEEPPGRLVCWRPLSSDDAGRPLRWFRVEFQAPDGDAPVALDLDGLGKGLAWVNGECVGRYWLIRSVAPGDIHTEHNQVMVFEPPGGPCQRYYHVPRDWLRAGKNTLLLFEETGGNPSGVKLACWRKKTGG
ncbi:beta-galactosidase [Termitidicoccus mucosus]|uniref:Beta-galactosidase n=1 Tax=Termitidicoccus mucosus TaxID=1184151 RepID=A0A178IMK3_9BACT|nr:hypothetical protein AW736_04995 [Opitutaceae bacterium TSB47]